MKNSNSKNKLALLCGILECLCYGSGDYLMSLRMRP